MYYGYSETDYPKKTLHWKTNGRQGPGRPSNTWMRTIKKDPEILGLTIEDAKHWLLNNNSGERSCLPYTRHTREDAEMLIGYIQLSMPLVEPTVCG